MSHEEQIDVRIRRTHTFLQEAMSELISEKGFDAITVGDSAERAMINRATFYSHDQDKYGLVTKIFEEASTHLVEDMKPFHKDSDPGEKVEIWNQFFEHVEEHTRLYRARLGKNGSPWFAARMREHIIKLILERERRWKHQVEPSQSLDSAMQLSHVLAPSSDGWRVKRALPPRQIATWFCHFAFYGYLSTRGYEAPQPGRTDKLTLTQAG